MSACMTALAVAGVGMKLGGNQIKKDAQESATNFNLKLADQNKIMIEDQKIFAVARHVDGVQRILGSQRSGYGGSGVTMEGTPTNVAADTATQGEIDRLAIVYGADVKLANVEAGKATTRFQGEFASAQSDLEMMNTILGGYTDYKRENG